MPRTCRQSINWVSNQLFENKNSTVSASDFLLYYFVSPQPYEALYSLGNSYGVEVRRPTKQPWINKANFRGQRSNFNNNPKRLSPYWIKVMKWFFVGGREHMANGRRPREEFTKAINKLNSRNTRAHLIIEDLAAVVNIPSLSSDKYQT